MKFVSYCLWGNAPKYVVGLQRNLASMQQVYPGWSAYIHWGSNVTVESKKIALNLVDSDGHGDLCISWKTHGKSDWTLMLDRFSTIFQPRVEVMISRDADSRLTMREKAAVDEWLESGYGVHTMHCHPHHSVPMLGGLWGCKAGAIPGFQDLLEAWPGEDKWQTDQKFLAQRVYPLVKHDVLNHDDYFGQLWSGVSFPTPREKHEFIGATYDEYDVIDPEQLRIYVRS